MMSARWNPTPPPVRGTYDVIVCGGGVSGVPAALSAAREGLRTLVVERTAQLGGTGVSGLVTHWLGGRTDGGHTWVVGGLFRSLARETGELGISQLPLDEDYPTKYQPYGWHRGLLNGVAFDPYGMAAYLDRKLAAAGVDVLFDTQVADAILDGDRVTHVVVANKNGLSAYAAKTFIDATGDADVAAFSGCETVLGREEDHLMTPATLEFELEGVDETALADYIETNNTPRFRREIEELRAKGVWKFPYEILISVKMPHSGTMMINTPRICDVDGTDAASVSDGIRRGRAEALELTAILRQHVTGFAHARIRNVAPALGVRETRRIVGDTVMTVDDVISRRTFDDVIGFSAYGWDLPDPKKPSFQPMAEKRISIPKYIPIPYAVMLPRPVRNLVCPGRAISVERDVLGPLRVMAPCMAMGEAAGCAAALAPDGDFGAVEADALRAKLRGYGAKVDLTDKEMHETR